MRCLLFLFFISTVSLGKGQVGPWEFVDNQDGIKVSKRVHQNSNLLEFRGEGVIRGHVATVLALLTDPHRMCEWIENCEVVDLLKANYDIADPNLLSKTIDSFYHVQYLEMFVPWPFQNRDLVLKGYIEYTEDEKTGQKGARLLSHRVDWPSKPATKDKTRMPFMDSQVDVKFVSENETFVDFRVRADPGGVIPEWLVNLTTSMLPLKTVEKIRLMVKKGDADPRRLKLVQHHIEEVKKKQKISNSH